MFLEEDCQRDMVRYHRLFEAQRKNIQKAGVKPSEEDPAEIELEDLRGDLDSHWQQATSLEQGWMRSASCDLQAHGEQPFEGQPIVSLERVKKAEARGALQEALKIARSGFVQPEDRQEVQRIRAKAYRALKMNIFAEYFEKEMSYAKTQP